MSTRFVSLAAVLLFLASAQSSLGQSAPVSFSFVDERGYDATRVSEWGRIHLRMVAPGWDLSAQRDEWSASLTSALGQDSESLTLVETGERTGVFEGTMEVWVNSPGGDRYGFIDTYRDYNNVNNNDVITAVFDGGAAVDTIEVVPSVLQLADDYGAPAASFAEGEKVHVRLRDGFANTPNLDLRPVTVTTSRGDAEALQISETGFDTGIFEGAFGVTITEDPPVPGNGALEVRAGDTLTAVYDDINGVTFSTATATVAPLALRFIDGEGGRPASVYLERSEVWVRVTYLDANGDPQYRDIFLVDVAADLSGETEGLYLWETGPDSGVFEGWVRLSDSPTSFGDGRLWTSRLTNPDRFDTLRINRQFDQTIYTATAATVGSRLRLMDAAGDDASAVAVGSTLYFQVEDQPTNAPPYPSSPPAQVILRSLATGDMETVYPQRTAVGSGLFEGSILVGTEPAVSEDGVLQAAPGETLEVVHADFNGETSSRVIAVAAERLLRFIDESGRSIDTLLEGRPARLRAFEAAAAGQPWIEAELNSILGADQEQISLSAVAGESGAFEGSILLDPYYTASGVNGILRVSGNYEEPGDTVTANLDPLPTIVARTVGARVRLLDDRGLDADSYPVGAPWHIRIEDPGANRDSGAADWTTMKLVIAPSGQVLTDSLSETGPDTGVFETVFNPGTLPVVPGGNVTVVYRPYYGSYYSFTDKAGIVARSVEFVDAAGLPTSTYLASGRVYVRAFDASANLSASQVDTLQVRLAMIAPRGENGDSEILTLTETGADTGLFTGSIGMLMGYSTPAIGDGQIQVSPYTPPLYEAEILRVYLADLQDSARFLDSVLRFVDAQGQDASSYNAGSPVRLRLERPRDNYNLSDVDVTAVEVFSLTSGDREPVALTETGPSTGVFEGSLPTRTGPGSPDHFDGILQVQGEVIQALDTPYLPQATDYATMLPAPAPVLTAVNDETATEEDTPITVDVLANDFSSSGPMTVTDAVITYGTGSVTIEPDFRLTYTPAPNELYGALITYTVTDGVLTATATLNVGIYPVNDPPVVVDDAATVIEDGQVTIDVLANDDEIEAQGLAYSGVTQGAHGSVTIQGNIWLIYTPQPNFNGVDTFTYEVTDSNGGFSTGTVTVTVESVNDVPDAVNDAAATAEDTAVTITVLANDGDVDGEALTVIAVTQGSLGAVTLNANGSVTYVPAPNANGADAFTYTVRDAAGLTDTATVTVAVAAVNDAPVAVNDTATTREGAPVTIPVLANDSDVEGNALTVTNVSASAVINPDGTVTYTPDANFNGADSFTYTVSDGQGGTATATVTVTVKDALERVAVLATHGIWIQTGADILSGDVIVNQSGAAPFLDGGASELSVAGTATTPAGYDAQADRIHLASGSTVGGDAFYNQLAGTGSITGAQTSPLTLPVFASLPALPTAAPGATDVNVANNGTRTLAPGSYRDLIVGRKGTVTFTGGVYHFRTVRLDREAKLYFSAAAEVRVQQKLSTQALAVVQPAAGAAIDSSSIVFFVAGANGTTGGLAETPKAVEIGTDNVFRANLQAPNGTIWLKDRVNATGAFLGKDVQVGPDAQITLDSYWEGQ